MSTEDDKFWNDHAAKLRDFAKLRPLTPAEAEEEAKSAPSVPLTDEELQRLIAAAVPCEPEAPCEVNSEEGSGFAWLDGMDTEDIEDGVLQLNRNKGEGDAETDETEEELRRRMLDDEEEQGGMEDGAGPPRQGGPRG